MEIKKLDRANELLKKIRNLEIIIRNCENQECEWIEFTFGNGSNKASVCDEKYIITKVRKIILEENKLILKDYQDEFKSL